jgi:hypothetical protein
MQYAESCRGPWTPDGDVDALCEEILLSSGLIEEAYERYALGGEPGRHLPRSLPYCRQAVPAQVREPDPRRSGEDHAGRRGQVVCRGQGGRALQESARLREPDPCDPKTRTRAAHDLADTQPAFALGAGLLALHWLVQGYGYEITGADVCTAYSSTIEDCGEERERRRQPRPNLGASIVKREPEPASHPETWPDPRRSRVLPRSVGAPGAVLVPDGLTSGSRLTRLPVGARARSLAPATERGSWVLDGTSAIRQSRECDPSKEDPLANPRLTKGLRSARL